MWVPAEYCDVAQASQGWHEFGPLFVYLSQFITDSSKHYIHCLGLKVMVSPLWICLWEADGQICTKTALGRLEWVSLVTLL